MLVKAFFEWIDSAPAQERAEAVTTLAQTYLSGAFGEDSPVEIEAALLSVLDDPSPAVRRALAMVLAQEAGAPRSVVLSLARDQVEVSGVLLARSPLLTDADLIDLVGHAERLGQVAIALRARVSQRVAGALVMRAEGDAIHTLLRNAGASIAPGHLAEIAEQYGAEGRMRAALLARHDLPPEARHLLMRAVAQALGGFLAPGGFLTPARMARVTAEALECGTLAIASKAGEEMPEFVEHLRERAELTPALLLRSALAGDIDFLGATFAELTELPRQRVDHLIAGGSEAGIGALVRKAGLPGFLVPVMVSTLAVAARLPKAERGNGLHMALIRAAQAAVIGAESDESLRLLALLRRYEAEAARAAARALAETLRARHAASPVPALTAPALQGEMLRLAVFGGDETIAAEGETEVPEEAPERDSAESYPDLARLIAEWKAEHAARDAVAATGADNENSLTETEKAA